MKINDAVTLGDARVSEAGYLEANARTARTGVQAYLGIELNRPDLDVVNVYRDDAEVFSARSLNTFSKLPVTMDHPPVMVDATNWRDVAVGTTGDEVLRDGEFLKIGLKITDAAAVEAIQGGKRELSVGYTTELVWGDGVTADGTPYQARQTNIIANHIAVVAAGRAGSRVRIGDGASEWGARPLADAHPKPTKENRSMTTRTIIVDGLSVELADKDAQIVQRAIDGLAQKLADAETAHAKALTDTAAEHQKALATKDAAIAEKDKALAAKDAEIDALKGKVLDAAALDARVAARADLLSKAKALAPEAKFDGLTDAAVRKAAVAAVLGDATVADKAEAYVDARFDILVEDAAKADPLRHAFTQARTVAADATPVAAQAAMVNDLTQAWKGKH